MAWADGMRLPGISLKDIRGGFEFYKREYKGVCEECGSEFTAAHENAVVCPPKNGQLRSQCQIEHKKKLDREYQAERKAKKKQQQKVGE